MREHDEKIRRAAHIKARTEGTSNEISLSVLDAARKALDDGRTVWRGGGIASPRRSASEPADVSRETSATAQRLRSAASPEEEVARRKTRRRLARFGGVALVVIATVAILAAGGTYLYHDMRFQSEASDRLDSAIAALGQADAVIKPMDEIVADPFSGELDAERQAVEAGMPSAQERLQQADADARTAANDLRDPRAREAAGQAAFSAAARQDMIEHGMQLLDLSADANAAASEIDDAWNDVLAADSEARRAAALASSGDLGQLDESNAAANQAITLLQQAADTLSAVNATYPSVDCTPLSAYIEKRVESLGYALLSNAALAARDKDAAAAQNAAYTAADEQAAELARDLPEDPATFAHRAYEKESADAQEGYESARAQAGGCDAVIRDYLGGQDK